jgi:hypothetical protein
MSPVSLAFKNGVDNWWSRLGEREFTINLRNHQEAREEQEKVRA